MIVLAAAGAFIWGVRTGLEWKWEGAMPLAVPKPFNEEAVPGPARIVEPPATESPQVVTPPATPPVKPAQPATQAQSATPPNASSQPAAAAKTTTQAPAKPVAANVPAKPAAPAAPVKSMTWPCEGGVLKGFDWTYSATLGDWRFHNGIDITGNEGDQVVAALAGKVESVDESSMYGVRVVILHSSGIRTVYSNCANALVKNGDAVTAGAPIASVGRGAFECLDPAHVHFEVISSQGPADPYQFLK